MQIHSVYIYDQQYTATIKLIKQRSAHCPLHN